MSYDFGVWYSDVPMTDQEAGELYVKLCEEAVVMTTDSAAVDSFYNELTSGWPEIDSIPGLKPAAGGKPALRICVMMTA